MGTTVCEVKIECCCLCTVDISNITLQTNMIYIYTYIFRAALKALGAEKFVLYAILILALCFEKPWNSAPWHQSDDVFKPRKSLHSPNLYTKFHLHYDALWISVGSDYNSTNVMATKFCTCHNSCCGICKILLQSNIQGLNYYNISSPSDLYLVE